MARNGPWREQRNMVVEQTTRQALDGTSTVLQHFVELLERADEIVSTTPSSTLAPAMLELLVEASGASAGSLFLCDPSAASPTACINVGPAPELPADGLVRD